MLTCATPEALEPMRFALRQLVRDALGQESVQGVGFGCKGIVDPKTTRVDRLPGIWQYLEGTRLRDLLDEIVPSDTPFAADNDAKAALAGEVAFGAARGKRNVMLLTLGTGIGGAILCDGQLLRGASGVAGHLGHFTVDPEGRHVSAGAADAWRRSFRPAPSRRRPGAPCTRAPCRHSPIGSGESQPR